MKEKLSYAINMTNIIENGGKILNFRIEFENSSRQTRQNHTPKGMWFCR